MHLCQNIYSNRYLLTPHEPNTFIRKQSQLRMPPPLRCRYIMFCIDHRIKASFLGKKSPTHVVLEIFL
jgi:hypothetical protein